MAGRAGGQKNGEGKEKGCLIKQKQSNKADREDRNKSLTKEKKEALKMIKFQYDRW